MSNRIWSSLPETVSSSKELDVRFCDSDSGRSEAAASANASIAARPPGDVVRAGDLRALVRRGRPQTYKLQPVGTVTLVQKFWLM